MKLIGQEKRTWTGPRRTAVQFLLWARRPIIRGQIEHIVFLSPNRAYLCHCHDHDPISLNASITQLTSYLVLLLTLTMLRLRVTNSNLQKLSNFNFLFLLFTNENCKSLYILFCYNCNCHKCVSGYNCSCKILQL